MNNDLGIVPAKQAAALDVVTGLLSIVAVWRVQLHYPDKSLLGMWFQCMYLAVSLSMLSRFVISHEKWLHGIAARMACLAIGVVLSALVAAGAMGRGWSTSIAIVANCTTIILLCRGGKAMVGRTSGQVVDRRE